VLAPALALLLAQTPAPRAAQPPIEVDRVALLATTPPPRLAALPALRARLRAERLAEERGWLTLGHYVRGPLGWKSEADGADFFRARGGQRDPAAELDATLAALFEDTTPRTDELKDPACRFPARLRFLRERLGIGEDVLPTRPCPRYQDFRRRVSPVGVTVVFSSYYLDNPASAFGHTLLRLDRGERRDTERAELLDYGVNYAAAADTANPLLYAVKGLLGGFRGEFTHYAYYYKVREYADAEARDLWEYDLALGPAELAMLVDHLWELGATTFDYWYLDENCSYHVLTALEAAAPRLELVKGAGRYVVLPSDTIKALFGPPGLVREVHHRPSIQRQFQARLAPLSPAGLDAVEALQRDPEAPLPGALGAERAAVLDAALDHLDLWGFKDLVLEKDPALSRRRQRLLERRAELGIPSAPLDLPPPLGEAPHRGHGSFRVAAGGGASSALGPLVLLEMRLALHDLLDPPEGYPAVAHIEFLPLRLRFAPRHQRVELDQGWLVEALSLNDLTRFDQRPSWRFHLGAETLRDGGGNGALTFAAGFGAGFATLGLWRALDLMAGADVDVNAAPGLAGLRGSGWRVGVGPSALLRLRPGDRAALLAEAGWRWLPEAAPRETWKLSLEGRLHLGRNLSLALRARRAPSEDSAQAVVYAYF
jgi:hypothetical protein